jgi:hypothetical protein
MGIICDIFERIYRIYEPETEAGDLDGVDVVAAVAVAASRALNSAQVSFFSGIGGRDVFADFVAARFSFAAPIAESKASPVSAGLTLLISNYLGLPNNSIMIYTTIISKSSLSENVNTTLINLTLSKSFFI